MRYKLQKVLLALNLLFLIFVLTIVAVVIGLVSGDKTEETAPTLIEATSRPRPTYIPSPSPTPMPQFEISYDLNYYSNATITEKIEYCSMAESLLSFLDSSVYGNSEDVENEILRITNIKNQYAADLENWYQKTEEYPIACEVWLYLTEELGLGDIQAAAIIGNMMVECGGYSLYLDVDAYDSGFYGICQWSTSYHYRANGLDLRGQLEYLGETLEQEFQYGAASYHQFINATNVRDASVYFAKGYERCADPYGRQDTAERAYSYFVE